MDKKRPIGNVVPHTLLKQANFYPVLFLSLRYTPSALPHATSLSVTKSALAKLVELDYSMYSITLWRVFFAWQFDALQLKS